jgi:glycosyltransferase involved in cell wall biosynthesis
MPARESRGCSQWTRLSTVVLDDETEPNHHQIDQHVANVARPRRRGEVMDVALLAEGTYPFHPGGVSVWCDQLIRGLAPHRFTIHAITAGDDNEPSWELPDNVDDVRPIALWGSTPAPKRSVRNSAEIRAAFRQLAVSMVDEDGEPMFLDALHQLFVLSQKASLAGALHSKASLGVLLGAMREASLTDREPRLDEGGSGSVGNEVSVHDASVALGLIEHQLRPLFVTPPRADLCHATSNGLAILLALGAHWAHDTPLVLSEHGIYLRERYLAFGSNQYSHPVRSIMLRFFKRLTWAGYQIAGCIAPGSEYNRQWLEANGADPDRINRVYNGVDVKRFDVSPSEPDVPTLVWLGRIDPLKDVETLIRSFAQVHQVLPEARLRIFGGASPENEHYRDRCVDLRDSLGLGGAATFEGRVDSVVDAYHAGHVVVLSSISEGFPYTLIEAMASGMPTVSTDVGGVREASGDAGLVVPPQHPDAMAQACLLLLSDADLRTSMGRAARSRILSTFTLEQSLAAFGDLYRQVTERTSSDQVVAGNQVWCPLSPLVSS